ncbi:MAG: hypothetical protein ACLFR8_06625 [Alkalispirochaeta sp.]
MSPLRRVPRSFVHLIGGKGPPLTPLPPRPARWLPPLLALLGPVYRRVVMGIPRVEVIGEDPIAPVAADPGNKVIFAFRHPSADDPPIMYSVLQGLFRRRTGQAKQEGTTESAGSRRYPVFLYGRDVPVWGGPVVAWLLPRIGGISVFHEQVQRESLDAVYRLFRESPQPVALAPEAQVTYHNYRMAPTQRGTARLAMEATKNPDGPTGGAGAPENERPRDVLVVPVGLEYRYPDREHRRFRKILHRGLSLVTPTESGSPEASDASRRASGSPPTVPPDRHDLIGELWRLYGLLFETLERHHLAIEEPPPASLLRDPATYADRYNERAHRIIAEVLSAGERRLGIKPASQDDPISRVFRLRRFYWEQRFPQRAANPLGDRIKDLVALEARVTARYFQVVDVLGYLDFAYLTEVGLLPGAPMPRASGERHARLVEYLLCAVDLAQRATGHTIGDRPAWRGRSCIVRFGDPISVPTPKDRGVRGTATRQLQKRIEEALRSLSVAQER